MTHRVLCLDLATTSGWCFGPAGCRDQDLVHGSHRIAAVGASHAAVFGKAILWIDGLIKQHDPDVLVYESPLATNWIGGKSKIRTNRDTIRLLNGLPAIAEGVAHLRGVRFIREAEAKTVGNHFIGNRNLRNGDKKGMTVWLCRQLGHTITDDNEADAIALHSYACALIIPGLGIKSTPLFRRTA